jgi:hypothetical protein
MFWREVDFTKHKAAEDFAIHLAVSNEWKCGIRQSISIPEQRWFFMNQLSWKNRFKIEVRDALAEIELSYDEGKLRLEVERYHFSGEELERALQLLA